MDNFHIVLIFLFTLMIMSIVLGTAHRIYCLIKLEKNLEVLINHDKI